MVFSLLPRRSSGVWWGLRWRSPSGCCRAVGTGVDRQGHHETGDDLGLGCVAPGVLMPVSAVVFVDLPERQYRCRQLFVVTETETEMLLAAAVVLLVLWALGLFVLHLGVFIHALIVIAVIVAVVHFVRGRGARV